MLKMRLYSFRGEMCQLVKQPAKVAGSQNNASIQRSGKIPFIESGVKSRNTGYIYISRTEGTQDHFS